MAISWQNFTYFGRPTIEVTVYDEIARVLRTLAMTTGSVALLVIKQSFSRTSGIYILQMPDVYYSFVSRLKTAISVRVRVIGVMEI